MLDSGRLIYGMVLESSSILKLELVGWLIGAKEKSMSGLKKDKN